MHLNDSALRDSAPRAARVSALDLLKDVRETRDRLDHPGDSEALHDLRVAVRRLRSWLRAFRDIMRDTLEPKQERRLRRIAQATGAICRLVAKEQSLIAATELSLFIINHSSRT